MAFSSKVISVQRGWGRDWGRVDAAGIDASHGPRHGLDTMADVSYAAWPERQEDH